MIEVSVEEISVRVLRLHCLPYFRERRDRFTTINSSNMCSGDDGLVVGDSAPIHVEGRAKLVQTVVK